MTRQKKLLGQHFLINQAAIKKIVAALNLEAGDTVIEIGPGRGALTFPILEKCGEVGCKLIAIEKDPSLASKFQITNSKFQIIEGDVLKELPKLIRDWDLGFGNWKLAGNIPYYITGKLLRIFSELENKPELIVLMIQKEVAERICAQPPRMNLLAAAVQLWAEPKILFTLKPEDFNPPPEVHSAVIKLETRSQNLKSETADNYYKMIKIIFKQPRKTLVNNLGIGLKKPKNEIENALKSLGLSPQIRPQNLSVKEIGLLTTLLL